VSERATCENCAKWADDFTKLEPELQRMVEFAKQCQRQRDELAEALRDSAAAMEREFDTRRCNVESLRALNLNRAILARIDAEAKPPC